MATIIRITGYFAGGVYIFFIKYRSHLKIRGIMTRSKFHNKDPQILGETVKIQSPVRPSAQNLCTPTLLTSVGLG
jgi:hypothetical protein